MISWSEAETYRLIIAAAKLLPDGSLAKTPTTFTTIADGNWDDPSVWTNGIVPDSDAIAIVRNQVIINVNISCYTLKVEQPTGQIKVNPNITVSITH